MSFIKLPNRIFSLNLAPIDILVFAALKLLDRDNDCVLSVRAQTIGSLCGIHRNSVAKAVKRLDTVGLLRSVKSFNAAGKRAANRYYLAAVSRRYFTVPSSVFLSKSSPSAFAVYAYLQCCANHAGRAFPSLRRISAHTGLCIDTVTHAVRALTAANLLNKQSYVKQCGCFGCNNYHLSLTVSGIIGRIKGAKRKAVRLFPPERTAHTIFCFILPPFSRRVKSFSFSFCIVRGNSRKILFYRLGVLEKMCSLY